jgi:hypothetical protein
MTKERWAYLKALQPPPPRMFWPASRGTYCENNNARKAAIREDRKRGQ